jgi:hypothetical protein
MLLADRRIVLLREPPLVSGHAAEVESREGTHEGNIRLNDKFDNYTRAEQRRCIVHELVHLHLFPLRFYQQMLGGDREDEVNLRIYIKRGHRSHEEYAVDDLARIIAPHMPLPPKAAKP